MAYTTINKSTDYFDTKLHNGNATAKTLAYDFEVDMFWTKMRNYAYPHMIFDAVRGNNTRLRPNQTNGEGSAPNTVSFGNSSGISLGTDSGNYGTNKTQTDSGSQATYVGWGWKANGAGSSNTDGSITSTVSVNTTAGFSIVKYAGSNSNITVGHGLGAVPKMIIIKNLSSATSWTVYHNSIGNGHRLVLNGEAAKESTNQFSFGTSPTSSVFALGGGYNDVCANGENYIAYCFAEKKGFSKFGSYKGNGNADGTFIYTGFKPAFVIIKRSDSTDNWNIFDNKRNEFNLTDKRIYANSANAEATSSSVSLDFLSNGFKLKGTDSNINNSSGTYTYMSFGQSVVGSNNIPATGR